MFDYRPLLKKVIDLIEDGKQKGLTSDKITDIIKFFYGASLHEIESQAYKVKSIVENNNAIHSQMITKFCSTDGNSQYKAIIESLMKSTGTKAIQQDIEYLKFALYVMEERYHYRNDDAIEYYSKSKDVLGYLNDLLKPLEIE